MKILLITPSYQPAIVYGGTTVVVSKLAQALTQAGAEVHVYTTTANGNTELNVTPNAPVMLEGVTVFYFKRLTKDHSHFSPQMLRMLYRHGKKFQVIHIHSWWNIFSITAAFLLYIRKWPYIISPHGMLSSYTFKQASFIKKIFHYFLGKRLIRAAILHGTSKQEIDEIDQISPKGKRFQCANIVDLPQLNLPTKNTNKEFSLGFLSRVEKKKNLGLLLDVMAELDKKVILQIAGSGHKTYIKALKNKIKQLGLEEQVIWLGWLDRRKYQFLQTIDLFVLPSYNENFAVAVLESLLAGTPVLLSKQVGLAGFVEQKKLGWIFDGTKEELKLKLIEAISQTKKRNWISAHASSIVFQNFDSKILAKNYLNNYQNHLTHPK